jgi:beta-phosphoglucomutase-like phosphatase (HAD superfamily)
MFSLFPPANVISADMLTRGKPFPDIYLAAAKSLGQSRFFLNECRSFSSSVGSAFDEQVEM